MKFCIKSETTFERRREKKGKILAKTLTRPYKMGVLVRTKFFGKRIPQKTHVINRVSQTHWNPTLSQEYKKNKNPYSRARKKKMVRPPVESRF